MKKPIEFGVAEDANTGDRYPMKLVQAVPIDARIPGKIGIEKKKPESKIGRYTDAFEHFVEPAERFLRANGKTTFSSLGVHLRSFDMRKDEGKPNWNELAAILGARDKALLKEFLLTFPHRFLITHFGTTYSVQLKGPQPAGVRRKPVEPPIPKFRMREKKPLVHIRTSAPVSLTRGVK